MRDFLKRRAIKGIAPAMLLRMLSVLLIALAMLAAPLTMREGMAMAAETPGAASHHEAAGGGHCDEQSAPGQETSGKAMAGDCCIVTCVAVVVPAGAPGLPAYHRLVERPGSDADRLGTLSEIATPPPRLA